MPCECFGGESVVSNLRQDPGCSNATTVSHGFRDAALFVCSYDMVPQSRSHIDVRAAHIREQSRTGRTLLWGLNCSLEEASGVRRVGGFMLRWAMIVRSKQLDHNSYDMVIIGL